ncbi:hypothetical protein FOA52_015873 [Chlamydomonas sp. UWO 241]|nr:hypothetical protein FOA52_015873 [Chlamydomonas sp. UWO 241]
MNPFSDLMPGTISAKDSPMVPLASPRTTQTNSQPDVVKLPVDERAKAFVDAASHTPPDLSKGAASAPRAAAAPPPTDQPRWQPHTALSTLGGSAPLASGGGVAMGPPLPGGWGGGGGALLGAGPTAPVGVDLSSLAVAPPPPAVPPAAVITEADLDDLAAMFMPRDEAPRAQPAQDPPPYGTIFDPPPMTSSRANSFGGMELPPHAPAPPPVPSPLATAVSQEKGGGDSVQTHTSSMQRSPEMSRAASGVAAARMKSNPGAAPSQGATLYRSNSRRDDASLSASRPADASRARGVGGVGGVGGVDGAQQALECYRLGKASSGASAADVKRNVMAVDVCLPPLNGKEPGTNCRLASGLGSLFLSSGDAKEHMCLYQYANAEADMQVPDGMARTTNADFDATECGVANFPDGCDQLVSIYVDDLSSVMWTGHKDRRVCRWSLTEGRGAMPEHAFLANRLGSTLCMCVTPWGDLWTGSSTGKLRVWAYPQGDATRPPSKIQECKLRPANGKGLGKVPHGKVSAVVASTTGGTVWSAGRTSIVVWCAYTMEPLGVIPATAKPPAPGSPEEALLIDTERGLHPSMAAREHRHPRSVTPEAEEEEPDAAQVVGKKVLMGVRNVSKYAKAAGRMLKKGLDERNREPLPDKDYGAGSRVGGAGADAPPERDDPGKVKAMVATPEAGDIGGICVAFKGGTVVKYTELGRQLWSVRQPAGVRCLALIGARSLWLGCADGAISVLDVENGTQTARWQAHDFPVISIASVGGIVYSICPAGRLRGWPLTPAPADSPFVSAWQDLCSATMRKQQVRMLTGTWNVNETRPPREAIATWLTCSGAADMVVLGLQEHISVFLTEVFACSGTADVVALGLQEVEMGTSSVATDLARNLINRGALEKGNENAKWWYSELHDVLGDQFVRVGLRQMSGLLIMAFCRTELAPHVGELHSASVACGVLGVGGNKGAVALEFTVFRRTVVVLCSHFAAHQTKVDERNDNYEKIMRNLRFGHLTRPVGASTRSGFVTASSTMGGNSSQPPSTENSRQPPAYDTLDDDEDAGAQPWTHSSLPPQQQQQAQQQRGGGAGASEASGGASWPVSGPLERSTYSSSAGPARAGAHSAAAATTTGGHAYAMAPVGECDVDEVEAAIGLPDAELVVWIGDFNYRINGGYDEVVEAACNGRFAELLTMDQLRQEADKGLVFRDLYEVSPNFPPTYKFDKNKAAGDDGRPLPYDSSEKQRVPAYTDRILWRGSLSVGKPHQHEEDVVAVPSGDRAYHAVMDVNASDHKPVLLELDVTVPSFVQELRRRVGMMVLRAELRRRVGMMVLRAVAAEAEDAKLGRVGSVLPALMARAAQVRAAGVCAGSGADISELLELLAARQDSKVLINVSVEGSHSRVPLPHYWSSHQRAVQPTAPMLRTTHGRSERVRVNNDGDVAVVVRAASCGANRRMPTWLEVFPASFVLQPGESKVVMLTSGQPDVLFAQMSPLEAGVVFCAEALDARGTQRVGVAKTAAPHEASRVRVVYVEVE